MKFIRQTLTKFRYTMAHIWDCDPLRRRPLSNLAFHETRLLPRTRPRHWAFTRL